MLQTPPPLSLQLQYIKPTNVYRKILFQAGYVQSDMIYFGRIVTAILIQTQIPKHYKEKVCINHLCANSQEECPYAHGQDDICAPLGFSPEQALDYFSKFVCKDFTTLWCKNGEKCIFRHRKRKQAMLNKRHHQTHLRVFEALVTNHAQNVDKFLKNY